ncbi:MAG: hypothetical protein OEZ06_28110 [Myxococcales bacterium]|nr:hypothetical protein [Myxococcales bacterium]
MSNEPTEDREGKSYASTFFKIFGIVALAIPLAAGVAWAGNGNVESWSSALVGVLFLVMIVITSGARGYADRD